VQDTSRFRGLLADLFPGAPISDATNAELEAALQQAAQDMSLQLSSAQVGRCLLYAWPVLHQIQC
jgi:hypothetical protein